jgi:hypothetical protein
MYNLAKAAEDGYQGPVAEALDYVFESNTHQAARCGSQPSAAIAAFPDAF